ncbi:MAG TPA: hypothetical protein ENN27_03050 [Candidatus Atribacteria bacterium]|nr:hypothetical protein [Candidatus Atribacteria bacterium]
MHKFTLIKKSILIIIMITMVGLGTGCTIFLIPTPDQTGTVHINIANEDWYYDIYLDSYSNYLGTTDVYGQKTFYDIPTGYCTFYAVDDTGLYSGQKTQYIHSGINFVDIYVYYNY